MSGHLLWELKGEVGWYQLDQTPILGPLAQSACLPSEKCHIQCMSQPYSQIGIGRGGGRVVKEEEGKRRKKLKLKISLSPMMPFAQARRKQGGKGLQGTYLFSLEHGRKIVHSPFPFPGGVYFNQQALLHPSCVCTHITVGRVARLT